MRAELGPDLWQRLKIQWTAGTVTGMVWVESVPSRKAASAEEQEEKSSRGFSRCVEHDA
jgi:hypothetical protein